MDSATVELPLSPTGTIECALFDNMRELPSDIDEQDFAAYVKYFGCRQEHAIYLPQIDEKDDLTAQGPLTPSSGTSCKFGHKSKVHILKCGHSVAAPAVEDCAHNCHWTHKDFPANASSSERYGNFFCSACFNDWCKAYSGVLWNELTSLPRESEEDLNTWMDKIEDIQIHTHNAMEQLYHYMLSVMRISKSIKAGVEGETPRFFECTSRKSWQVLLDESQHPKDNAREKLVRTEAAIMGTLQKAILNFAFVRVSFTGRVMEEVMGDIIEYSSMP